MRADRRWHRRVRRITVDLAVRAFFLGLAAGAVAVNVAQGTSLHAKPSPAAIWEAGRP